MPLTENQLYRLSPRLQAIADLVPACGRVLDIGTDHAWLPIELVKTGRCQEAAAIDIRPGPLNIAARHIRAAGLEKQIRTVLNDGLRDIVLNACDVVIMAGLGGNEMMHILENRTDQCQSIILQPMKSLPELRLWLTRQGFSIDRERLVIEKTHSYIILQIHYTGETAELDLLSAWVGPRLLLEPPLEMGIYLRRLLHRLTRQSQGDPGLLPLIGQIENLVKEYPVPETMQSGGLDHDK